MARVAGVAVVLAAVLASASAARPPRVPGAARAGVDLAGAAPQRPKHVVLIVADDLGWSDLGFRNKQQIRTPTLDGLAARGAVLTQLRTAHTRAKGGGRAGGRAAGRRPRKMFLCRRCRR